MKFEKNKTVSEIVGIVAVVVSSYILALEVRQCHDYARATMNYDLVTDSPRPCAYRQR